MAEIKIFFESVEMTQSGPSSPFTKYENFHTFLIVYLYLVKNALQGKLLPFTSAEEQKFVDFNVLNKQHTLTWNDILRKDLNLKIPEEENFFWLDGTAWNYTNFKDFRISLLFLNCAPVFIVKLWQRSQKGLYSHIEFKMKQIS